MPLSLTRYYLLDVFTAKPFTGNQLAVFLGADGIEAEQMQAIANELNLAETVFVGKASSERHFPVRIFTPYRELPFAGHPTVGTAHLLAAQGLINKSDISAETPLVLEMGAGPVEITFEGELARFKVTRPAEIAASSLGQASAAEVAGLELSDIHADPVLASCGLPFHLVPLASVHALERLNLDPEAWVTHITPSGVEQAYFFVDQGHTIEARMFSFSSGNFIEDPATGSAAAALAGYLGNALKDPSAKGKRYKQSRADRNEWRITQGEAMGRISEIRARASLDAAESVVVEIAGEAVLMGEGGLYPRYR